MDPHDERHVRLLADAEYREVLAALDDAGRPLHVDELAERGVRESEAMFGSAEYERRLERERLALHHDRLPRLADADLIGYDREANTASARGEVAAGADWLETAAFEDVLSRMPTEGRAGEDAVGVIKGRRAAIEQGRKLADEAEEELFCMYVSTALLEGDCLRHARAAVDRGVEMFMGSRDADVRALTREHLPEATIWEPRRGWMGSPWGYPKVGRLVLVDRRKVMLALLDGPGSDGDGSGETAMVGEGEANPLVVLVRTLLGPRLDHLDLQSTDFRSELPT